MALRCPNITGKYCTFSFINTPALEKREEYTDIHLHVHPSYLSCPSQCIVLFWWENKYRQAINIPQWGDSSGYSQCKFFRTKLEKMIIWIPLQLPRHMQLELVSSLMAPDKKGYPDKYFFLFLHEKRCCGYSLEVHWQGASNEYPQHTFSWRNKKNVITFGFVESNLFNVVFCCFFLKI